MSVFKRKHKSSDAASRAESIRREQKFLLWNNDDFFLRESYKSTRTNILFSLAGMEGCRVIAVTSSMQSEGKSITSANLAISFEEMGYRVLLIDCDLRKPKQGRLLSINAEKGLSDTLIDKSLLPKAIHRLREDKNLWVICAGRIPPNPSELLGSEAMRRTIGALKERFDMIILDTPPVDMVTDAIVLSPLIDGMLITIRANQTDRRALVHALDQLEYSNTKILGLILNGSEQVGGGYGYKRYGYSRYGYRYGYGRYGYGYRRSGYGYGYSRGYGYGYGQQQDAAAEQSPQRPEERKAP